MWLQRRSSVRAPAATRIEKRARPRASLSGSLSHEIDGRSNINLSTSYTIYDGYRGGQASANRERAALSDEQRRLSRDSDFTELEFDVIEAYTMLQSAGQTLEARRLGLERRREELRETEVLAEFDQVSRVDLLQAGRRL